MEHRQRMIEFIKSRIIDGQMGEGFQACSWDNCAVFAPIEIVEKCGLDKMVDKNAIIKSDTIELSYNKRKIKVLHSRSTEFDYLSTEGVMCDSTLTFQINCVQNLLLKLLCGASYDTLMLGQKDPMEYDVEYVVGDVFLAGAKMGGGPLDYFYGSLIPVKCILIERK